MPKSKHRKKAAKRKAPARFRPPIVEQPHDRIIFTGDNIIISCSDNLIDYDNEEENKDNER